ncbi:MAG: hypothetical protein JXP34_26015 [Planctomycetes bacterium]|nr:hypothetical protein [Planctomycetota bacterium]
MIVGTRAGGTRRPLSVRWLALPVLAAIGCMGPAPRHEGEVGRGTNLWPIVEVSYDAEGRETDILWPLFAFDNQVDRKYYAFRPIFMIETDPEGAWRSADFLFPIFHAGTTGTRKEFALRPLFGRWRDPEREMIDVDMLFPIGWWRREPGKTWLHIRPIVWYKSAEVAGRGEEGGEDGVGEEEKERRAGYFHIFPIYGLNRDGGERRLWFLTPLFTHWRDGDADPPDWTFNAVWPLLHIGKVGEDHTSWLFPLFLYAGGPRRSLLAITPLFWDYERAWGGDPPSHTSRATLVLPFYGYVRTKREREVHLFGGNLLVLRHRDGEGSVSVAWPLFHHGWDSRGTATWLFPIYWRFVRPGEDRGMFFIWPPFGYRWKGDYREYSTCWPLFWYGSGGDGRRSLAFLPPLLHHARKTEERWSWNILFPFLCQSRRGEKRHSRFFPFYLWWKDEEEDSRHTHILWPLFRRVREGDEMRFRVLLPYITYREKGEEHDFRIFWKWIRSTRSEDFDTLRINPFFRRDTNASGDLYWSILGGLFSRKREGDEVSGRILWVIPYSA